MFRLVPNAFHHGALGAVRSLGRMGVRVHANVASRREPLQTSRYADRAVVWRTWPSTPEQVVERLTAWARTHAERPVLIPVDDAAAVTVAEHGNRLSEHFLFPRQDAAFVRELSDKLVLARRCEEWGVPAPRTVAPRSRAEAEEIGRELTFPVVVKRIANRSQSDYDEPSVRIVTDPEQLSRLWDRLEARGAADNYLLQEFIPGGPESVWMFNGYFDDRSRCLVSYTGFKLRQYPPGQGPTTLGECRRNETVAELAVQLLGGLGYRGIVDAGFRYDARDGRYKLLDVNPRIGATFRLFVTPSGTDVARAMYLDLTSRPVPTDEPEDGRRWLVEPLDLRTCLRDARALRGWPRSLRGVRELAWAAADDPLPAAAMTAAAAARAVAAVRPRPRRSTNAEHV